ncbi:hypothetical protein CR513_12803, partial [Mucuna pruriens]
MVREQPLCLSKTFYVAKLTLLEFFCHYLQNLDRPLQQLDVKNVFLNGDLEVEVYMESPPVQHDETKHVEIERHCLKMANASLICMAFVPTTQVANILTKGLFKPTFEFFISMLGMIDTYAQT